MNRRRFLKLVSASAFSPFLKSIPQGVTDRWEAEKVERELGPQISAHNSGVEVYIDGVRILGAYSLAVHAPTVDVTSLGSPFRAYMALREKSEYTLTVISERDLDFGKPHQVRLVFIDYEKELDMHLQSMEHCDGVWMCTLCGSGDERSIMPPRQNWLDDPDEPRDWDECLEDW